MACYGDVSHEVILVQLEYNNGIKTCFLSPSNGVQCADLQQCFGHLENIIFSYSIMDKPREKAKLLSNLRTYALLFLHQLNSIDMNTWYKLGFQERNIDLLFVKELQRLSVAFYRK